MPMILICPEKDIVINKRGKDIGFKAGVRTWVFTVGKIWNAFRKQVLMRDGYKCVFCGAGKEARLEVDHIKPTKLYPKLYFDMDNCRTLCHKCHIKTPTYGSRKEYFLPENIRGEYNLEEDSNV